MSKENKARKEIYETQVLVDYLIFHQLDFNDLNNFTNKRVKEAMEWRREQEEY